MGSETRADAIAHAGAWRHRGDGGISCVDSRKGAAPPQVIPEKKILWSFQLIARTTDTRASC